MPRRPSGGALLGGLLLVAMAVGCVALFAGLPLIWLWVASQLQNSTSLGAALAAAMAGALISIFALAWLLQRLNNHHAELRAARAGPMEGPSALERMLVLAAAATGICFVVWFLAFSGASPIPVNA